MKSLRLQILHETPLCPRQPQTLRNGVLGWWETLKTNVTACRATLRNGSYHNNFDSQLYIICIDYCISLANRFSWSGHWRAIPKQVVPSVGLPEALGENLQSRGFLSLFTYGCFCFRRSLSFPSHILPGLELSCESVTKDYAALLPSRVIVSYGGLFFSSPSFIQPCWVIGELSYELQKSQGKWLRKKLPLKWIFEHRLWSFFLSSLWFTSFLKIVIGEEVEVSWLKKYGQYPRLVILGCIHFSLGKVLYVFK